MKAFYTKLLLVMLMAPALGFVCLPIRAQESACQPECRLPSGEMINTGEVLHDQRKILFAAARPLKRERENIPDLYFIAFGGDATQNVFLKEVVFAQDLFDERFGTARRSLVLINNPATLDDLPLANVDNLRLALNWMGRLMDTDEDVLFLFLTSHGTRDHRFVLNFPPFQFDYIEPPLLRELLDKSGIEWRVIVISACYSGGFIEPLKTEKSLIITAARADRTSFGCTNDADFTYFGRAFFDEALWLRRSFLQAFEIAKQTIERRETAQNFPRSYPQIHTGEKIRAKLVEIERRLADISQRQ